MKPILIDMPLPITTPRIILRAPTHGDGKELNDALAESFIEIYPWMPWARSNTTTEQSEEFARQAEANWILKNNKALGLVLFLCARENPERVMGVVALHEFDWSIPCMELGYWMRTSYAGKGYMLEAVNAVTQYAFKHIKVKRLEIRSDPRNAKSVKIAQRLKYTLEARLKEHHIDHVTGNLADTLIFVRHNLNGLPALQVEWPDKI
jgi:ribosomal-protein-serine acetyltransferase